MREFIESRQEYKDYMKLYNELMSVVRREHEKNLRKRLRHKDFSILSQNCIGGVLYRMLGMQMLSPTINMSIQDDNFLKLAQAPYKYIHDLEPFPIMDQYYDGKNMPYPVIGVGDIRLNCMHYQSCEQAINDWNRRRKRFNFNKMFAVFASWDMHNNNYIDLLHLLEYPYVLFSYDKVDDPNTIILDHSIWKKDADGKIEPFLTGYYKNGYKRNFEKVIDFVEWINETFDEEKQR